MEQAWIGGFVLECKKNALHILIGKSYRKISYTEEDLELNSNYKNKHAYTASMLQPAKYIQSQ